MQPTLIFKREERKNDEGKDQENQNEKIADALHFPLMGSFPSQNHGFVPHG
jgi:hypothetical protein